MTRTMLAAAFIAAFVAAAPLGAADAMNTLTDKEKADGWKLLFDGQTTKGWHGYNQTSVPEGWAVKDGALTRVAKTTDIVCDEEFENFALQFDWKLAKNGNSGVFYHVIESPKYKEVYFTGPEYQLLDNAGHPDGKNGPDRFSGANYALHAPSQNTVHTPGEWNQSRIVVNNGARRTLAERREGRRVRAVEQRLEGAGRQQQVQGVAGLWDGEGWSPRAPGARLRGRVQEHQDQAVAGQGHELT